MGEDAAKGKDPEPATVETVKIATDQVINRRSRWLSAGSALRYVTSVQKDNDIKVRDSDKATAIALLFCCFIALLCLVIPQLEDFKVAFVLVSDVLVGVSLLMYVANRFGIVTTFQARQALLTWQLMLGSCLLGVFLTINLALSIAWAVSNTRWISL